jgi:hypothetical protein
MGPSRLFGLVGYFLDYHFVVVDELLRDDDPDERPDRRGVERASPDRAGRLGSLRLIP